MIYLVGMSHGLSVVKAFDHSYAAIDIVDFERVKPSDGPLPVRFETLSDTRGRPALGGMKAFLISAKQRWFPLVEPPADGAERGPTRAQPGFLELLAQIPQEPGTIVLSMLYGNEHSILSIVEHEVPYDFVYPPRPEIAPLPGRQIVPWPAVELHMWQILRPAARALAKLRQMLPQARIMHFAPPPPIGSAEQILSGPEALAEKLAKAGGITPASIRLKYHHAQIAGLVKICADYRISLMGPPKGALTSDGLLRPEFWCGATHANAGYGDLVLDQIERWIKGTAG